MKRILEPESMDLSEEIEVFDRLERKFFYSFFLDQFVDTVLNLSIGTGEALDIGSGTGIIPIKLHRKNPRLSITGLDISPGMVEKARENLRREGLEGAITFVEGDGKKLPFDDRRFDLVTCNHVLHHVEDPAPFFNEVARVATDDAAIVMRDVCRPWTRLNLALARLVLIPFGDRKAIDMSIRSMAAGHTPQELNSSLKRSRLRGARVVRYYLIPRVLENFVGIEKPHRKRGKGKKLFPENITIPILGFPGKKSL